MKVEKVSVRAGVCHYGTTKKDEIINASSLPASQSNYASQVPSLDKNLLIILKMEKKIIFSQSETLPTNNTKIIFISF